jgi:hypothetical protein
VLAPGLEQERVSAPVLVLDQALGRVREWVRELVGGQMDPVPGPVRVQELAAGRMDPAVGRAPVQVPELGLVRERDSVPELGRAPVQVRVSA